MADSAPRYRLVIFDAIDDPQELRELICRATGMHPTDAVQWLARAPGVWPQPLDEADGAQAARRAVRVRGRRRGLADRPVPGPEPRRGRPPRRLPGRGIPDRGPAGRADALGALGPGRDDLRGQDRRRGRISATSQSPRWPSAVVAGIRAIALQKPRPSIATCRASRVPRDPVGEVLIVRRDPRIAFRVVENQMNYAYLGERLHELGRRELPGLPRRPLRPGRPGLPDPVDPRPARGQAIPANHEFPSSQALLDYATHRLLWSWYRRDRDADPGPPTAKARRARADPRERPTRVTNVASRRSHRVCRRRSGEGLLQHAFQGPRDC